MSHDTSILTAPQRDMLKRLAQSGAAIRLSRHDHISAAQALVRKGYAAQEFDANVKTYAITEDGRKQLEGRN